MANEKTTTRDILVLKTAEGYLHHDIEEGAYLEEGERNYQFTDNPFEADEFYEGDWYVPKYIDVTAGSWFTTTQEVLDFLGGELVTIKITTSVKWEEVQS